MPKPVAELESSVTLATVLEDRGADGDEHEGEEEGRQRGELAQHEVRDDHHQVGDDETPLEAVAVGHRAGEDREQVEEERDDRLQRAAGFRAETQTPGGHGAGDVDRHHREPAVPRHAFEDLHGVGDPELRRVALDLRQERGRLLGHGRHSCVREHHANGKAAAEANPIDARLGPAAVDRRGALAIDRPQRDVIDRILGHCGLSSRAPASDVRAPRPSGSSPEIPCPVSRMNMQHGRRSSAGKP
ncbi:MAG: hypothetical protein ACYTBR_10090 [Planctomycetota bacterium]